jgi:hypothetical protein
VLVGKAFMRHDHGLPSGAVPTGSLPSMGRSNASVRPHTGDTDTVGVTPWRPACNMTMKVTQRKAIPSSSPEPVLDTDDLAVEVKAEVHSVTCERECYAAEGWRHLAQQRCLKLERHVVVVPWLRTRWHDVRACHRATPSQPRRHVPH